MCILASSSFPDETRNSSSNDNNNDDSATGQISKRVCFDNGPDQICWFPAIEDYEEQRKYWLTRQDITRMEQELQETLDRLSYSSNSSSSNNNNDARGLEWYLSPRAEERLSHRAAGVLTVLQEQSRAIHTTRNNDYDSLNGERLAFMYQRETEHCLSKASMQGIRDEMEAIRIYNEDYEQEQEEETNDSATTNVVVVASQDSTNDDDDDGNSINKDTRPAPQEKNQTVESKTTDDSCTEATTSFDGVATSAAGGVDTDVATTTNTTTPMTTTATTTTTVSRNPSYTSLVSSVPASGIKRHERM